MTRSAQRGPAGVRGGSKAPLATVSTSMWECSLAGARVPKRLMISAKIVAGVREERILKIQASLTAHWQSLECRHSSATVLAASAMLGGA